MILSQVIDTGRSLGSDVKVQAAPTQPQVLGQSITPKQEVHSTFQDGLVEVYTSSAGQMYLSVKPVIVFAVMGVLVLAVFLKLAVLFAKQKKVAKRAAVGVMGNPQVDLLPTGDTNEVLEDVPQASPRPKIRRLTL